MDRKALKDAFKNRKTKMGVYQIRNLQTNRIFVGSSLDLDAIWNRHRLQLNMGNHPNAALQTDWNTLGEQQFAYEIVAEIKQAEDIPADMSKEVKLLEQLYLEELKPYGDKGYHNSK